MIQAIRNTFVFKYKKIQPNQVYTDFGHSLDSYKPLVKILKQK